MKTSANDQVSTQETAKVLELARECLALEGDFVELGCYRGDTSVLLGRLLASCGKPVENSHKNCGKIVQNLTTTCANPVQNSVSTRSETPSSTVAIKRLYIYDSFEGLPEKTSQDSSGAGANFQAGALTVSKREVIDKLRRAGLKNVVVRKAWFSDLTPDDLPEKISFAFIDGDFYESQRDGLRLVVPRLVERGIIVCHDYNNPELPGASRAVDEFLRINPGFRLQIYHTLAILKR